MIKLDLASGTTERIGITMPGIQMIAVDPEGLRIAFDAATQAPNSAVWILPNVLGRLPAAGGR